jgi:multiple sugar transport system permease protein
MTASRALRRKQTAEVLQYVFILIACAFALVPILWAVLTSIKAPQEISLYPPTIIPHAFTFDNYLVGVFNPKFMRYLLNTAVVVGLSLIVSLGVSSHAAHAVSRSRFRGAELMLMAMFSTIMVPGVAIIVPLYLLSVYVGLYDTLWILVLAYSAWLTPTLIWLLRGFVANIPNELEESARIDGCSRWGAFYRITLPLLRPGLLAGSVLVFANIWNEFVLGYSLVLSDEVRLVQVGIYANVSEIGIRWGPLTAAAIGASLPVLIAYAFMQRAFIQGLSAGAVKG